MNPSRIYMDCSTIVHEGYDLHFSNDALPALPIRASGSFWDLGAEYRTLWAIDAKDVYWTNYGGSGPLIRIPMHEFHKIVKQTKQQFMEDMEKVDKAMLAETNRTLMPTVVPGTD